MFQNNIIEQIQESINQNSQNTQDNNKSHLFKPIRCTEQIMNTQAIIDGGVYFTTDTQKIYLGVKEGNSNKLMEMSKNKNFFYGLISKEDIGWNNSGHEPPKNILFPYDKIEGEEIPEIDDLILNADGCFYKVIRIIPERQEVDTERLTVAGSGGGGIIDGPDGPSSGVASWGVRDFDNFKPTFVTNPDKAEIKVMFDTTVDLDNRITKIEFSLLEDFSSYAMDTIYDYEKYIMNVYHSIDISPVLRNLSSDIAECNLYIRFTDRNSNSRPLKYVIKLIDLTIESNEPEIIGLSAYKEGEKVKYIYTGSLGAQEESSRAIIFSLFDNNGVYLESVQNNSIQSGADKFSHDLSSFLEQQCGHGVYNLEVKASVNTSSGIIYSNSLKYKVVVYRNAGFPLIALHAPDIVQQYDEVVIKFMVLHENRTDKCDVNFSLGNDVLDPQNVQIGEIGEYTTEFEIKGNYLLRAYVEKYDKEATQMITVVEYTKQLPVFFRDDSLKMFLTAKGRNNNVSNYSTWVDRSGNGNNGILTGFYYGTTNGWLLDDYKSPCLIATQESKVEFNNKIFNYNSIKNYGLTVELDFYLSHILKIDENKPFIECLQRDQAGKPEKGFMLTGDEFSLYASGSDKALLSEKIESFERIRLTFVIEPQDPKQKDGKNLCLLYLNGILTKATPYFNDYGFGHNQTLKIDSSCGQINLYNIRVYETALSANRILLNYQASLSKVERELSYYDNLILDGRAVDINLSKIESDLYTLRIPYVKITGNLPVNADKDNLNGEWIVSNNSPSSDLPNAKDDFRLINLEIVYPKKENTDNFDDYQPENVSIISQVENGSAVHESAGQKVNSGAIMYAQGTSSLSYPVKNLRVKCKGHTIKVTDGVDPVDLICFKADYMESSGSHNTGAGNFIDNEIYANRVKTPGQRHYGEKIITCIKGYPCVIFWSPNGTNYKYIGKYNLNLDKATPEPFGFAPDDNDQINNPKFGYNSSGEPITACFEFLDNNEPLSNFMADDPDSEFSKKWHDSNYEKYTPDQKFDASWNVTYVNDKQKQLFGWTRGFELRYPETDSKYLNPELKEETLESKRAKNASNELYKVAKWIYKSYNEYESEKEKLQDELRIEKNNPKYIVTDEDIEKSEIDYGYQISNDPWKSDEKYFLYSEKDDDFIFQPLNKEDYEPGKYYIRTKKEITFNLKSLNIFKEEYQNYFNKDFLLLYYVITETLLMADSRVKNMMIATWGPEQAREYIDWNDEKKIKTSNEFIWYPIFYDMDTMLGLNNEGYQEFSYSDNDDNDNSGGVFNGENRLWILVKHALQSEIAEKYGDIAQSLKFEKIDEYFTEKQSNIPNETFYNEDAEYKYILPFRGDYKFDEDSKGTTNRLYAVQGNRSLNRKYFIKNRLSFLNGKYGTTNFTNDKSFEFRYTYPDPNHQDERIRNSVQHVKPSGIFELTASKKTYAGVKIGQNNPTPNIVYLDPGKSHKVETYAKNANGTEAYILGFENITKMGSLADKYPSALTFNNITKENNVLTELVLGSMNKYYYNPFWAEAGATDFSAFSVLEYFDFSNCKEFKSAIKLSGCQQLKRVLAIGSDVTQIQLPASGIITELRLPRTVKNLSLENLKYLTNRNLETNELQDDLNFTYGEYEYQDNDEWGIDKDNYKTIYTPDIGLGYGLENIKVINTDIDTYKLVKETSENFSNQQLSSFMFEGFVWTIDSVEDLVLDKNNYLSEIKVLKYLDSIQHYDYSNDENSRGELIGTIIIKKPIGISIKAKEYDIYKKYIKRYPKLVIQFDEKSWGDDFEKAPRISIYSTNDYTLQPLFTDLVDGQKTIEDILDDFALIPIKPSTTEKEYNFSHWFIDSNENGVQDDNEKNKTTDDLYKIIPTESMIIQASYTEDDRFYSIHFSSDDNDNYFTIEMLYNHPIYVEASQKPEFFYEYKNDSNLGDGHKCYTFKGWQNENQFGTNEYLSMDDELAWKNENSNTSKTYRAYFVEEDAIKAKMSNRIFTIESFKTDFNTAHKFAGEVIKYEYNFSFDGYKISINQDFKELLKGKITLPAKDPSGNIIKYVDDCTNLLHVKDVYFEEGNQYESIGIYKSIENIDYKNNGFNMLKVSESSLTNIYLPKTLKFISSYAFIGCIKLTNIDFNGEHKLSDKIEYIGTYAFGSSTQSGGTPAKNIHLNELPTNLKYIGGYAFCYQNATNENIIITKLPEGLKVIPSWCFNDLPNMKVTTFGGKVEGLEAISSGALVNCGKNIIENSITINPSIQILAKGSPNGGGNYGAFTFYGPNNKLSVVTQKVLSQIKDAGGQFYSDEDSWANTGLNYNSEESQEL